MKIKRFTLGILEDPISKQLKGELPKGEAILFDSLSDSINHLLVKGLLTDAEVLRARKRLMARIQKAQVFFVHGVNGQAKRRVK